MQKVFSARLDESVLNEMERATRERRMTKRRFLEEAIRLRAAQLRGEDDRDVWAETLGAWQRNERPETSVRAARRAFQRSITRHHRGTRARLRR
jgi:hypothetical protein